MYYHKKIINSRKNSIMSKSLVFFVLFPLLISVTIILLRVLPISSTQIFYVISFEGTFITSLLVINEHVLNKIKIRLSFIAISTILFFAEIYLTLIAPFDYHINVRRNLYKIIVSGTIATHVVGIIILYFILRTYYSNRHNEQN